MTPVVPLTEERVRLLRQGLWDCFRAAGGDTDGDESPHCADRYLIPMAVEGVESLRRDDEEGFVELEAEVSRLSAALADTLETLERIASFESRYGPGDEALLARACLARVAKGAE